MPRTPNFTIHSQGKQYFVFVPASLSESGTREKRYFKTQALAKDFIRITKAKIKDHGVKSIQLSAETTMDALKAVSILDKMDGVTLAAAAAFYVNHHSAAAKCPTLAEAFDESIERRQNLSAFYIRDMKAFKKKLPEEFLNQNCYDITGKQIAAELTRATGGATMWHNRFRIIRTIFSDLVKSGTLKNNPCANIHPPKFKMVDEVHILTPQQCHAIFDSCRLYDDGITRDCRECAAPFAILIFGGVRPIELTRLTWDAVNLQSGFIRLSGSVTKTGKTRNVHISDTLRAWLETVPEDRREGKIIPNDWRRKSARVRKEAGLDGHAMMDAPRHTYGSFTVALEGIDYVRSCMGHGFTQTFERHYHNAMTIPQAKEYLAILPPSAKIEKEVKTA